LRLTLRARLAFSFALAVAATLVAFSLAVVVVLAFAERAEHRADALPFTLRDLEDAPRVLLCMALVAPFAVGGAAALGLWLARKAVAPLKDASERARRARAAFDLTLPLRGTFDEWDELALTLNALLGDGRSAFERIRRFTADAAHELRTPLTAIIGEADVTLRKARTAEELRASLLQVREAAVGMSGVIEALLTLARADAGALRVNRAACALGELAAEARTQALGAVQGPGLSVSIEGAAPHIEGDRVLLVRALRNLIENGLRHGGPSVRVRLQEHGGKAAVAVEDDGPGVPEQLRPVLFQRFARADESRSSGGIGLGLSLARAIAEAHGGTLELLPSARGAAFELLLPRA
jgi:signal transduction histidine kinase